MFVKAFLISLVGLSVSAASLAADSARHYVPAPPPTGNAPAAPFSEGVMVGGVFYVAGHIGMDPATQKAAANPDTEAHLVMDAVKQTLSQAGLSMDDLTSVTVYCTDLSLYDAFNTVYRSYFHGQYPARAFIGVNQLVRGAHFEVAGVAVKSRAADR
ncbi:MAG TPA: Rid family hydrolase [Steroidobacteraceae bacterium]|jgi:reactive intermediate/imine deaminase|nr:Rid family hydrolase [Steroidobacteraceae bacterium]